MTIETTLQVHYNLDNYTLLVKMIKIDTTRYFFIRDTNNEKHLLKAGVLELTFSDSFSLTKFRGKINNVSIPNEIISVIQEELLKNIQTWTI